MAEITAAAERAARADGRVMAVLGERLTPSLVVEIAIASHDLPFDGPPRVRREAGAG